MSLVALRCPRCGQALPAAPERRIFACPHGHGAVRAARGKLWPVALRRIAARRPLPAEGELVLLPVWLLAVDTQWQGAALDIPGAYQGLVDLMNEQREKVNNASAGFEESRYAQVTMADLRNNFAGTTAAWALFHEWLDTKSGGSEIYQRLDQSWRSRATPARWACSW